VGELERGGVHATSGREALTDWTAGLPEALLARMIRGNEVE
jgi:hypothetical protein